RVEISRKRVRRGDVDGVRERIRTQHLQSARQTPLELDLKRMVVRRRGILSHRYELKARIRVGEIDRTKQVSPDRNHIRHGHALVAAQRLLDGDILLVDLRKTQMGISSD